MCCLDMVMYATYFRHCRYGECGVECSGSSDRFDRA
jgi:hypothetical protein